MRLAPLYIFDLDGTLADTEHRQHILKHVGNPYRWRDFFEASVRDTPNTRVVKTLQTLASAGAEIYIWSGRSDAVFDVTVDWVNQHIGCDKVSDLRMRGREDHRPDEVLKREWLDSLPGGDFARLVAIFDDRDKVVKMWRDAGVACFQVAEGAF